MNLLLYTKKAARSGDGAFGLKERLLFCLLRSSLPPRELMDMLCMAKSNLALLAGKCIKEGLIEKSRRQDDGRALTYSLTEKGRQYVLGLLEGIEHKFDTVLTAEKERETAARNLDGVIELLSYLP